MTELSVQRTAKQYERLHNVLFLVEALYVALLLVLLLTSGVSRRLARLAENPWLATTGYAVVVVVGMKLAFWPLAWFSGYYIEHHYRLSTQRLASWVKDEVKSLSLAVLLGVVILNGIYFLLRVLEEWWWVGTGAFLVLFGVALSALFPVLILPMFYRMQPLENEELTRRLCELARRAGANVLGVYRVAMSEKTRKANAALAGVGKTKRILLGDTLIHQFEHDEIEVVLAHELAHHRHGDLWWIIAVNALTTFVGLWVADRLLRWLLPRFGFEHVSDLAAFPLLALCLYGFGLVVMPLNNAFSRWRERLADAAALELTRNPAGFIRAMRRLAEQNLADPLPHPAIEFLLHDHPSLSRRIQMAEQWQPT